MQMDLSCSESGEDLSNSFESPCWQFADRDTNRICTRAYSPPIAMEVRSWSLACPARHSSEASCAPPLKDHGSHTNSTAMMLHVRMQDIMTILGEDNMQILSALLADEEQYHVTSDYMDGDTGIGPEHRHFLVSWMMTVHFPFPCTL